MSTDLQSQIEAVTYPDQPTAETPSKPTSGGKWVRRGLIALVGLGALGAAGAMTLGNLGGEEDRAVLTHEVQRGDLVVSIVEQGTLESSSNTEIKCRVKGGSTVLWVIESGTVVEEGDELVRLDQSTIEDNINQQKIVYETALANFATSQNDVAVAQINIREYEEGTFKSSLITAQKDVVISKSNLKSAKNTLEFSKKMFAKGYISALELETQTDAVTHAELELKEKETALEALEKFTKEKELQNLRSLLEVAKAQLGANEAALQLEKDRLERNRDQLENCIITAETSGMVIHPSQAEWKETPDIEEGASVREDQVLLIIPDLDKMQVKVGIHESKIDRLQVGMPARVQLQGEFVEGEISEIASITKGGGWWTGNLVKYDTVIELDRDEGLKPGMTVSVEVFLAKHKDVLTVPVAAVLELDGKHCCWVSGDSSPDRREVKVGDSNDTHIVVEEGLNEGDLVVLNPRDFVDEAEEASLTSIEERAAPDDVPEFESKKASKTDKPAGKKSGEDGKKPAGAATPKLTGATILGMADSNKDGVLTLDEMKDERSKNDFSTNDTNGDGKLDEKELDEVAKKIMEAMKSMQQNNKSADAAKK